MARNDVVLRFGKVGCGVVASECYLTVCVSECVSDLAYLWGNVCECRPSLFFVHACV